MILEHRENRNSTGMLSVVMPAYNEGGHIYENALTASRMVARFADKYEILVVNDGSKDDTLEQITRAAAEDSHIRAISAPLNAGKGRALCIGTEKARGALIAFCDADLDLAPDQLEGFLKLMDETGADVVIGSKMHPESKVEYPLVRRVYSWGYYIFLMILFRLNVKDTQTGLKLFKADVIKPVMRQIMVKRFAFDIEVLSIINSRGFKIVSAPIEVVFRRGTFGRIGMKDVLNMFVDTLAVFYRLKILHYYDKHPVNEEIDAAISSAVERLQEVGT